MLEWQLSLETLGKEIDCFVSPCDSLMWREQYTFTVSLKNNAAVDALIEMLESGSVTIEILSLA